jgi:RNA polymerase-interacting CarD/CdnL/TRCF family regulator
MDKHALRNHIAVLNKLRDVCGSQLDIGALTELDEVISDLQRLEQSHHSAEEVSRLIARALQVIAAVVNILTNIGDFLK